jgi:hypothetical protein
MDVLPGFTPWLYNGELGALGVLMTSRMRSRMTSTGIAVYHSGVGCAPGTRSKPGGASHSQSPVDD